jgi:two-component system response regulator HydG
MERVADTDASVLLTGETGTGKGLVARALHAESRRAAAPFVTVNCAALPESLLESELFGHVKGAFTGATAARAGLFAEAHGGTLFLDEIGEMTPALQAKLLDVLERAVVRPVGDSRERAVDVRVVAATHRDLRRDVHAGRFREDLFYRLDVVTLEVPPLRARLDDLPRLTEHFLQLAVARYPASTVRRVSPEAMARLGNYRFPGNVRELAHLIERAVLLGRAVDLQVTDLPAAVLSDAPGTRVPFHGEIVPVRELQRRYAAWALEQLGGHRTRTAERLGVDAKTLAKWLADEPDEGGRT